MGGCSANLPERLSHLNDMQEGLQQFERFIVAMPCIIVCAICGWLIVMKMVGGDLDFLPGFIAFAALILIMYFCVNPPHPWVPGVGLVVIIALMATFPFAEKELEKREQREYDVERLERAFQALSQKPDNPSAAFEVARWLRVQGFQEDALAIAEGSLGMLGTRRDEVKNMSVRDAFRAEEAMVKQWRLEGIQPLPATARVCPSCKTTNDPGAIVCKGCGGLYLLEKVRLSRYSDKVYPKLLITYAMIAFLIVGGSAIGLAVEGTARWVAVFGAVAFVGVILTWLFRPPQVVTR